jgi:energy-coupling factor transport system substrate-specific component
MSAPVRENTSTARFTWRVVDIVIASVIGVACSVIFLVWNIGYEVPSSLLTPLLPGIGGLLAGPWLIAGVIGGLVVRKPGAAIYTELLAAVISALIGNQWGPLTIVSGLVQGLGAEIILAIFLYRAFGPFVAALAGAAAGLACGINDSILWYAGADALYKTIYISATTVSGAVVAGIGGWLVVRALAATGVLGRFAAGRDVAKRV